MPPRPARRASLPAVAGAIALALTVLLASCGADRSIPPLSSASVPPPAASPSGSTVPTGSPAPTTGSSSTPATSPGGSPSGRFDPARVKVDLEPFIDGLEAPLGIVNAGDGSNRLFIVEQGGHVRLVRDARTSATPFLDVSAEITSGGERGLLGLAFHPRFPGDPRVFVDYTDANGNTQVSSFTVDPANPDRVDPGSEAHIISVEQPFANHNGGALVFDPAGFLLIALGDGGSGGDPHGNGQSPQTLLGKILRIDVDKASGDRPYSIPADNPFADGRGGRPEIWLTGLRNPWRIGFDRANGDLWIGDVGQNAWEEIDVQRAGAPGGTNFGWNRMEGSHCFEPSSGCEDPALTGPVTDYGRDEGCTVIGGVVDRSATISPLTGGYVFGDYCSGRIWALDPATDGYRPPVQVADSGVSISAFGEDEAGAVYLADIGSGRVLRVVATAR